MPNRLITMHSNRRAQRSTSKSRHLVRSLIILVAIFLVGLIIYRLTSVNTANIYAFQRKPLTTTVKVNSQPATVSPVVSNTPAETTACSSNTLDQLVIVSVSQRHLWACSQSNVLYDSPVITGMQFLAADLTPVGTYHVYQKITNTTLRGSDSTGSWNDPVSYWMPFLDNQYGEYGFHDATWRPDSAFGNISPNSANASHGCVECPLATAAWLYSWVKVGTTVSIES